MPHDVIIEINQYDRPEVKLLKSILVELRDIRRELKPKRFPTSIIFKEITMALPTVGGNTLVFTGTLVPAGSQFPTDATFSATANDPAVLPTVDSTGLVVTVPLPSGWLENPTTPLSIAYSASSASNPTWTLSATITPSVAPDLPTGITFVQTT